MNPRLERILTFAIPAVAGIGIVLLLYRWVSSFEFSFGWIATGVFALVAIAIWRRFSAQAGATAVSISTIVSEQPIRGILIGAVLLVVAYLVYDHFWSLSATLVGYSGISVRVSWFVLGLLALLVLPSIFVYFSPTGLPVEASTIKRAARGLMFVWILFFGWLFYERPNDLYGHADGTVKCWIAENDPKIYSSPGFSSLTGAKLRQCTKKESLAAAKQPWTEEATRYWQRGVAIAREFWTGINKPSASNGSVMGREKPVVLCGGCVKLGPGEEKEIESSPWGLRFIHGSALVSHAGNTITLYGKSAKEQMLDVAEHQRRGGTYICLAPFNRNDPVVYKIRAGLKGVIFRHQTKDDGNCNKS